MRSRSDTWPDIQIPNPHVTVVNGFIEPVTEELPMEYAVEPNRLIQLEMVDSIG